MVKRSVETDKKKGKKYSRISMVIASIKLRFFQICRFRCASFMDGHLFSEFEICVCDIVPYS